MRACLLSFMLAATACAGGGGAPVDSGPAPPAQTPQAPEASACTANGELSAPLRRLTRREYALAAQDLLGLAQPPSVELPSDAIAAGFDNNAAVLAVSPLLAEKYLESAEELAARAITSLPALLPCDPQVNEAACASAFVDTLGSRAYRRPLREGERERLLRAFSAGREGGSFEEGAALVIQTVLQSPGFLYRFELGTNPEARSGLVHLSQHELASRLSFLVWGSMPSRELFAAADASELADAAGLERWARQLLADARAKPAISEFYRQWLGLGALVELRKDPALYPQMTDELRSAMAAELPAFTEHVLWRADAKLSTLLGAPFGFVSGPLAELYGVSATGSGAPTQVMLDPSQRSGILTQAGVLAVHALPNQSSPVARGKFVRERLLCQLPPPPPANLNVTPPEVDPSKSTRERFAEHTESAACSVCHELMDPIGFAFESYDAIGRYRASEGGVPIDTSGFVAKSEDADGPFQNVRELGQKLSESQQVRRCVATQWFRYAFGRHEGPADTCSLTDMASALERSDGNLVELVVALTRTEAFRYRSAVAKAEVMP